MILLHMRGTTVTIPLARLSNPMIARAMLPSCKPAAAPMAAPGMAPAPAARAPNAPPATAPSTAPPPRYKATSLVPCHKAGQIALKSRPGSFSAMILTIWRFDALSASMTAWAQRVVSKCRLTSRRSGRGFSCVNRCKRFSTSNSAAVLARWYSDSIRLRARLMSGKLSNTLVVVMRPPGLPWYAIWYCRRH